ncbi:hypothetical protein [Pedobacter nanyangensis]|uniref:hypothetical protein n=1 Tax=Pedobacter nanyangensis TaxID=1562389 RepID=UPI001963CF58|nr:hypothetical protein [Pedobacter nanyangensis]
MKNYLKQWNFMRLLRLALGILIVVQGVATNEWLLVGLGALFSVMSLMNLGGCGISGCRVSVPSKKYQKSQLCQIGAAPNSLVNENTL